MTSPDDNPDDNEMIAEMTTKMKKDDNPDDNNMTTEMTTKRICHLGCHLWLSSGVVIWVVV
jgi:hypothetical protein